MITIKRDHRSGHSDLFTIKLSAPGTGYRSITYKGATLRETQLAIAHYYEPGHASHMEGHCLICRDLAHKRTQAEKRTTKTGA